MRITLCFLQFLTFKMIGRLFCLLILCFNVKDGLSQDLNFNYKCIENNANISYFNMCDGNRDCRHGSDESAVQCKYNREKYEDDDIFYCANGAVISINLRCNGIIECADGSDEAVSLCEVEVELNKSRTGNCPEGKWQCPTGQKEICIYPNQTCDNVYDCLNGWDESVEVCMRDCHYNEYQCGNGVCIQGNQVCDNTLDCIDGSDELPITCQENIDINKIESVFCSEPTELHLKFSNETQFYSFDVNGTNFVYPNMGVRFVCHNPKISIEGNEWNVCNKTGQWLRELPHCERNMDPKTNGTMGCPIDTYAKYNETLRIYKCGGTSNTCEERTEPPINDIIVRFECEQGYTLLPNVERAECMNKTWTDTKGFKSPRCVKFCNREELYCLDSVKPMCRDENKKVIDCLEKQLFRPQTTATIGCNFGFKNVDALKVTCLEDGTWENIANISNACQFDCRSPGVPLTKKVAQVKLDHEQSVVFIYEDINLRSHFAYSCAGTIVRPNVVLTAAHCVFNRTEKALRVLRDVGKSYINTTDGWAVEKIFYPSNYDGNIFSLDIGILHLKVKHTGDEMSNAICLPGYKNSFSPGFNISRGEFDALETLDNSTNTLGNLTMVPGRVVTGDHLEYEVQLLSAAQLCKGDSGSAFIGTCDGNGKHKCLYGVLSHSAGTSDGDIPCTHRVVVARTTHVLVQQFILGTLDQIENKCD